MTMEIKPPGSRPGTEAASTNMTRDAAPAEAGRLPAMIPETSHTRLHYFEGRYMRAADFTREQNYQRELVQTANAVVGAGVVWGLEVSPTSAASGTNPPAAAGLRISPGLAIDGSGRTLYLPVSSGGASLPFDALLRGATTDANARGATATSGCFGPCVEGDSRDRTPAPEVPRLWVLYAAYAEQECGRLPVQGRLCNDACNSATEFGDFREGVRFWAEPLHLTLPYEGAKVEEKHLRARVASAWFARDWRLDQGLVADGRLLRDGWCKGARQGGGDGLPLAVFSRGLASGDFIDAWTVRRERMETTPRRYWASQMRMRSWADFLAQVLQFQCQRAELGDLVRVSAPMVTDPCAEERLALEEALKFLQGLPDTTKPTGILDHINEALTKPTRPRKVGARDEGELFRRGFVELPPAGYLPVEARDGAPTVNDQVRAMVGSGVDLRFCNVSQDYVAHALEEAQHMERISLLDGFERDDRRPKVDVLVPDGREVRATEDFSKVGYEASATVFWDWFSKKGTFADDAQIRKAEESIARLVRVAESLQETDPARAAAIQAQADALREQVRQRLAGQKMASAIQPIGPLRGLLRVEAMHDRGMLFAGALSGVVPVPTRGEPSGVVYLADDTTMKGDDSAKEPLVVLEQSRLGMKCGLWGHAKVSRDPRTMDRGDEADVELRAIFAASSLGVDLVVADATVRGRAWIRDRSVQADGVTVLRASVLGASVSEWIRKEGGESGEVRAGRISLAARLKGDGVEAVAILFDEGERPGDAMLHVRATWGADSKPRLSISHLPWKDSFAKVVELAPATGPSAPSMGGKMAAESDQGFKKGEVINTLVGAGVGAFRVDEAQLARMTAEGILEEFARSGSLRLKGSPILDGGFSKNGEAFALGSELRRQAQEGIDILGEAHASGDLAAAMERMLFAPPRAGRAEIALRATHDWVLFTRRRECRCDARVDEESAPELPATPKARPPEPKPQEPPRLVTQRNVVYRLHLQMLMESERQQLIEFLAKSDIPSARKWLSMQRQRASLERLGVVVFDQGRAAVNTDLSEHIAFAWTPRDGAVNVAVGIAGLDLPVLNAQTDAVLGLIPKTSDAVAVSMQDGGLAANFDATADAVTVLIVADARPAEAPAPPPPKPPVITQPGQPTPPVVKNVRFVRSVLVVQSPGIGPAEMMRTNDIVGDFENAPQEKDLRASVDLVIGVLVDAATGWLGQQKDLKFMCVIAWVADELNGGAQRAHAVFQSVLGAEITQRIDAKQWPGNLDPQVALAKARALTAAEREQQSANVGVPVQLKESVTDVFCLTIQPAANG